MDVVSTLGSADTVRYPGVDRCRQQSRSTGPAAAATPPEHVEPRHRQSGRHRLPAGARRRTAQHLPAGYSSPVLSLSLLVSLSLRTLSHSVHEHDLPSSSSLS